MTERTQLPRYIKIAQDICGKILTGEFPEGTLLKGRSILGSMYNVSPETIRKALNLLEKEKVVEIKRGVGVYVDSVLHAQQFAESWKSKTLISNKYTELKNLLAEKKELDNKIDEAIKDMKDSFSYQTHEAVHFSEVEIPQDSWIDGKTIGEVYFWNYTEATIVAIISKETGRAQQSPGPDFTLHVGDKLLFVGKDDLSFDRVLSFLVYGVLEENAEPQE
mgnify:FL=1